MCPEGTILKVNIYGTEYPIRGDVDIEYIRRVAEYVDRKMREVDQNTTAKSSLKVAILAALNIADELFRERDEKASLLHSFEAQADRLSQVLHENLK